MTAFLWIKFVHVISATILFGTGIGTAFFMLKTYLSRDDDAMRVTARNVVIADWLFTAPAVVIQAATGLWLTAHLNIAWSSTWFIAVVSLFVFVGACWIPVVLIQIRIRDLLAASAGREDYAGLMRAWVALGIPAFMGVLVLFYLMISRLGAYS